MLTRPLETKTFVKAGAGLSIVVSFVFAFSSCAGEFGSPVKSNEKISKTATQSQTPTNSKTVAQSQTPTEEQMKLIKAMKKRANNGITISATDDVLTITEMNSQDKAATIYYLLNLRDNDSFVPVLRNAGFKQLKFIRRYQGRTQVNNYQVDFSKPMTDEAVEYID